MVEKKLKKILVPLFILIGIFCLYFVIANTIDPHIGNYYFEDYKIQEYNNVLIVSEKFSSCFWKPDNIDDGYKNCSLEVIVWNRRDTSISLDMIKDKFDFKITKMYKNNKLDLYYSTDFTLYEEERINQSIDDETGIENIFYYNVSKIKFSNWKELDNLSKSLAPNKIVGIKLEFELPKYSDASWNFTYTPANFSLDPDISACGTLSTADSIYTLTQNVSSSGTCFDITAENITLDCNGYEINYSWGGTLGYGVVSNSSYIAIQNCQIIEGNPTTNYKYAIYLLSANDSIIDNNTIATSGNTGYGIYLSSSSTNTISNNTIATSGSYGYGIYLDSSSTNTLSNNTITTSGSTGYGIYLYSSSNSNTFSNNTITTSGSSGRGISLYSSSTNTFSDNAITTSESDAYGIYLSSSSNSNTFSSNTITTSGGYALGIFLQSSLTNTFSNNTITTSGDSGYGIYLESNTYNNTFSNMVVNTNRSNAYAIYIYNTAQNFTLIDSILNASDGQSAELYIESSVVGGEINFTNVSREDGNWNLNITRFPSTNGTLNVHWYLDVNVTDSANGNAISGANITTWDNAQIWQFENITDATGIMTTQTLLEYSQNESGTLYFTPYNMSVIATNYNDFLNETVNFTTNSWNDVEMSNILSVDIAFPTDYLFLNYNTSIDINYTYTNATNLDTCWYSIDEGLTNTTTTCMLNFTLNLTDNNYLLYFWINDSTATEVSDNVNFTVDTTYPQLNITYPENITYTQIITELNYTFTETNPDTCWYSINEGATNTTITCGNNVTGLNSGQGTSIWKVWANDSAGNINDTTQIYFYVDSLVPQLTIRSPENKFYDISIIDFNITANEDLSFCNFTIDNWASAPDMTAFNVTYYNYTNNTMADGQYTAKFTCNDTLGNLNDTESIVFFVDTILPVVSFGTDTLAYGINVSESGINITVVVTELNFANITYEVYNDTDNNYTETFYDPIYSINLTGRRDGNYYYNVTVMDNATNLNFTETRLITLDTNKPYLTQIDEPLAQAYSFSSDLDFNFTVKDETTGIFECWFNIINSTNDYMNWTGDNSILSENTTLTNCQNMTFNLTRDGTYTLTLYSNDSANNFNSSSVTFSISSTAPAVVLNSPSDNTYFADGTNIYFNFTATDSDGLDTCELWSNWTNEWTLNYTWILPESAVQNFTIISILTDTVGVWNIKCNDTNGLEDWALNNFSLTIDTIPPNVEIISPTNDSSFTGMSFAVTYNISDKNIKEFKYNFNNGANTSFAFSGYQTESITASNYGFTYLYIYGVDLAGNENSSSIQITLNSPPPGGPAPGPGLPPEEEENITEIFVTGICGNKLCESPETCYGCPEDCGKCNLDNLLFSCFAGTPIGDFFGIPNTSEVKSTCIKNQSPVLFYISMGIAGLTILFIFLRSSYGKKAKQKIYQVQQPYQPSQRKRRSWIKKYIK